MIVFTDINNMALKYTSYIIFYDQNTYMYVGVLAKILFSLGFARSF